jgi:hypothetical protein
MIVPLETGGLLRIARLVGTRSTKLMNNVTKTRNYQYIGRRSRKNRLVGTCGGTAANFVAEKKGMTR